MLALTHETCGTRYGNRDGAFGPYLQHIAIAWTSLLQRAF